MGCSNTRHSLEPIDNPISYTMRPFPSNLSNNEIITKFSEAENILKQLETLRSLLIDSCEELSYETGACTLKSPSLEKNIKCFFYYITYQEGSLSSYQPYFNQGEDPYFLIEGSDEMKNIANLINTYIKKLLELEETFPKVKEGYLNILEDFNENNSNYKKELTKEIKKTDPEYNNITSTFSYNYGLIQKVNTTMVFSQLCSRFEEDIFFLGRFSEMLSDERFLTYIEMNSQINKRFNYNKYEICYYAYDQSERYLDSPERGMEDISVKIEMKKDIRKE